MPQTSIKKTKKEQPAHAFNISWRINHGTVDNCLQMIAHIKAMDDLVWWEWAIEKKPDKVGQQYHLHMSTLFTVARLRTSLARNICRHGQGLGKKDDPKANITSASTELTRAYDELWIQEYCHGKEFDECACADESHDEFPEEFRSLYPSNEEQEEFKQIKASVDKGYEELAIEFDKWCHMKHDVQASLYDRLGGSNVINKYYDEYQDKEINLAELVAHFLHEMRTTHKRLMVPSEKRKLVYERQMFEYYVATRYGETDYWRWYLTKEEIGNTPSERKKERLRKLKETDEFIKSMQD